jgi:uncharacterized protein (DUF2252 family)
LNIIESTKLYENWLQAKTDAQAKLLSKKHEKMADDLFPFIRATFYRWVQRWRKEYKDLQDRDQDVVLAVGDLHIENFGTWFDSRGQLVWGINDFDEACELPFTNDLVRIATSILLAAEFKEADVSQQGIFGALMAGYTKGIRQGGAPIYLDDQDEHELVPLVRAARSSVEKFWETRLRE